MASQPITRRSRPPVKNQNTRRVVEATIAAGWSWENAATHLRMLLPSGTGGHPITLSRASVSDHRAHLNVRRLSGFPAGPGRYVMRMVLGSEVLAEGTLELTEP